MRKIIVYIATSADGYIARKDGAVDWLDRPRTAGDYGIGKFYKSIDTILWGRKTYEMVLQFQTEGKEYPDIGGIKNYAFFRRPPRNVARGFEFVKEPIQKFAKRLRAQQGRDIWVIGGAGIRRRRFFISLREAIDRHLLQEADDVSHQPIDQKSRGRAPQNVKHEERHADRHHLALERIGRRLRR